MGAPILALVTVCSAGYFVSAVEDESSLVQVKSEGHGRDVKGRHELASYTSTAAPSAIPDLSTLSIMDLVMNMPTVCDIIKQLDQNLAELVPQVARLRADTENSTLSALQAIDANKDRATFVLSMKQLINTTAGRWSAFLHNASSGLVSLTPMVDVLAQAIPALPDNTSVVLPTVVDIVLNNLPVTINIDTVQDILSTMDSADSDADRKVEPIKQLAAGVQIGRQSVDKMRNQALGGLSDSSNDAPYQLDATIQTLMMALNFPNDTVSQVLSVKFAVMNLTDDLTAVWDNVAVGVHNGTNLIGVQWSLDDWSGGATRAAALWGVLVALAVALQALLS